MSDWQPIDTAPKCSVVLLYAHIPPTEFLGFDGPQIVTGYFDAIDDAWCTTVSTVFGPFVTPTHWMPLPAPPTRPQALGSALLNDIPTLANQAERTRLLDGC